MERFIRIGVITAWPEGDWHSDRLLAALTRRCDATPMDPATLSAWVGAGGVEVASGPASVRAIDAFVLVRGLGRAGDPDVQFEIYRALEETGSLVVNRLGPLLSAQDKFRTSWLLARAGLPTPRAAVAQTATDAEVALAALGECVVKPIAGSLGEGVERVAPDAAGRRA